MMKSLRVLIFLGLTLIAAEARPAPAAKTDVILAEAEAFQDPGGWALDQQAMDVMGSPYLLAHGLGTPVQDATTTIKVKQAGTYTLWVRTRDWVAPWKATGAPGKFQVLIDGKPVPVTFGTEGAEWHWQAGGTVPLPEGAVKLALHDLTGYEGRCDAIILAADAAFTPPNDLKKLTAFRNATLGRPDVPEDGGSYDLVVVGGGTAGTCAALAAARLGVKVALVQDRPVLGGNNSSEVRVWLQGARNKPPYPRLGDIVRELEQKKSAHYGPENTAEIYEDQRKLDLVKAEPNITLLANHRVNGAEAAGGRIQAVVAEETTSGRRLRVAGRLFADCTGDGGLGALAGADCDMTLPGHMGQCNLWNVADTGAPVRFPRCPWALDLSDKPFPGRGKGDKLPNPLHLGGWYWEAGFDHNPIENVEAIRDWNFRAMYGAWDALKNVDGVLPTYKLNWCAFISGKRESRRLLGDLVLTKDDLLGGRRFPDGFVVTGWKIDVHLPDKQYVEGFQGDAFIAKADFTTYPTPFWIPYRCLYSRNVANLFMAGRDISVTHEALGTVRVMRTGGLMGEVVGMAATVCRQHDATPRDVYEKHLGELTELVKHGAGKLPPEPEGPEALKDAGTNLAPEATVRVSGNLDAAKFPPANLNDGRTDWTDNAQRWISGKNKPIEIELEWKEPKTIGVARVISGYRDGGGNLTGPVCDFTFQVYDGKEWKEIPGTQVAGNAAFDWSARFAPVRASQVRLVVTKGYQGQARIWEIELYGGAK